MPEYPNLAELREELTIDDPDRRANAYGTVLSSDVEVSDVLESNPDDDVVEELVDDDVIPPRGPGGGTGRPAADRQERVIQLLEDILQELETDAVVQEDDV